MQWKPDGSETQKNAFLCENLFFQTHFSSLLYLFHFSIKESIDKFVLLAADYFFLDIMQIVFYTGATVAFVFWSIQWDVISYFKQNKWSAR